MSFYPASRHLETVGPRVERSLAVPASAFIAEQGGLDAAVGTMARHLGLRSAKSLTAIRETLALLQAGEALPANQP